MNDMNPTPDNFLQLDNETKIKFCNAWHALARHYTVCKECQIYLLDGDGDLCAIGKHLLAEKEIAQAIPPAFAEHLARQIWGALTAANNQVSDAPDSAALNRKTTL